jgi:hypothetical protein
MQSLRVIVVAAVGAVAISILAGSAHAREGAGVPTGTTAACVVGCNTQKQECLQTARTAQLACKQDCRQNAAPGEGRACMKACMGTLFAAKNMCWTDQRTCLAGCVPPKGAPGGDMHCRATCGTEVAGCARDVATAAKTCVIGCRAAPDHLACLKDCTASALTGAHGCSDDFEMCNSSCTSPTPTPTPSGSNSPED